jgi:uncharacterized hydrophobic protein (TIGR00341 family)
MALRLVEIFLPSEKTANLFDIIADFPSATLVQKEDEEGQLHVKLLMAAEKTELLLDKLEATFHHREEYRDKFRILITPVQATIPRIDKPMDKDAPAEQDAARHKIKHARVSREELYANIHEASKLTWLFAIMVAFSAIVAAIGLLRNNTAVVIGAMVIAPLLGPNVALALASALGDKDLAKSARRANIAGIFIPFFLAMIIGIVFKYDSGGVEIMSRTNISLSDIVLALITGCIASLSFTMAMAGTLIGVMVAVALLPPLVASGILLGAGEWKYAIAAGLLFLTNLICVNLAGVITFLVQGVQPLWWWDKEKAKKATRRALITWVVCLALLVLSILASQRWIK